MISIEKGKRESIVAGLIEPVFVVMWEWDCEPEKAHRVIDSRSTKKLVRGVHTRKGGNREGVGDDSGKGKSP